ncbi:MAG: hypothetical protein K6C13_11805 [Oscillospiraceae bacterium]|nr:hypothetical protein [Oscillospiraceae bacterium]
MRLSEGTKTAFLGNVKLIEYCNGAGISLKKLNKCSIERMGNDYVFVLQKDFNRKSHKAIMLDYDIETQPDVVLIMKYENGGFSFQTTEKTIRLVNT